MERLNEPDAVAQARDAYEDAYYEWRSERKKVAASVAVELAIKADKAWSALIAAVRAECEAQVDGVRSENGSIAEQAAIERIQNPLFNRWPIELSDAEDAAMKAMLDSHHCGAPDEDDGKYCGGCVSLAWAIVRASRIKGAEEYKAAHPAALEAQ